MVDASPRPTVKAPCFAIAIHWLTDTGLEAPQLVLPLVGAKIVAKSGIVDLAAHIGKVILLSDCFLLILTDLLLALQKLAQVRISFATVRLV